MPEQHEPHHNPLVRGALVALGMVSLATGVIGIFLPLIPTTGPLLLAAVCFDRSSPRFHSWLMNNRYLGSYIKNYREGRGLPMMQKVCTIGLLWTTISISILFAVNAWWGKALLAAVAIGVTWHVASLPTYRPEASHER
jgi:uncharacterized membrane protein YbaN (DUF454 family)